MTRCRVATLLRPLHLPSDAPVLKLKAYFDDTGWTESDAGQTCVATGVGGCVATVEAWDKFEADWQAVLDKHLVKDFHAENFEHYDDKYKHITDRDAFLNELLAVLEKDISKGFGGYSCVLLPPDGGRWLDAFGSPPLGRKGMKSEKRPRAERFADNYIALESDPYCACLMKCIVLAIQNFAGPANGSVHMFVADQPKRNGKIGAVYNFVNSSPKLGRHVRGLSYGEKMNPRSVRPLQAADFAAYYIGRLERGPSARAWIGQSLEPKYVRVLAGTEWFTEGLA
jgi:hypothetical protein